jgi:hypothetical protein
MNKISCPHTYSPPLPTLDNRMFSPERRHGHPRVMARVLLSGDRYLRTKGLTPQKLNLPVARSWMPLTEVMRIRDVYPGSAFFLSRTQGQKDSGSWIRIKEYKYC